MEKLAAEMLPDGFGYEWTDARLPAASGPATPRPSPSALAVVFVFLVLAAQYESLTLPLAVILIVPMCLLAADHRRDPARHGQQHPHPGRLHRADRPGRQERHPDRRVRQAGSRSSGLDRYAAAVEAARLRLRPILMTSFAFIFGVVPLVLAIGAGAEMRQALGTAVFSGMIGVTAFGLIFTPVFYVLTQRFASKRRRGAAPQPAPQPAE